MLKMRSANVRFWPKADIRYLIIEAVAVAAPERLLTTQSGRSATS